MLHPIAKQRRLFVAKYAAILFAIPILILANSSGPPPRSTGAPGDTTCARAGCHSGTVNPAGGRVEVTFPDGSTYTPGVRKRMTVTVADPSGRVFGFQLTARLASNEQGGQAGSFVAAPGLLILCEDGSERPAAGCRATAPVEFISHAEASATNTFQVDWTPPATAAGNVRIYVAANAANGNGRADSGDRIFTANATLTPGAAAPRPTISATNGVVNGASFAPGMVSGSWVTIFGTNLASETRIWRDNEIVQGRLPTALDGVSVSINNRPAAVYFISPGQINVQAPTDDAIGPVQVRVTTRDGQSDPVTANYVREAPAFFLFDPENRRFLAAVHTDGVLVGRAGLFPGLTTRPARPGDTILLFGTGFGPTNPAVPAGQVFSGAAPLVAPVRITIGGAEARVAFAGLSGAGLYQFNVTVPDVPNGDQAVLATINSASTQANAFLTIQR